MGTVFSVLRFSAESTQLEKLASTQAERTRKNPSAGDIIAKAAAIDRRVGARQVDELIGICRGVLADGELVNAEIGFLADWLETHLECSDQWPYSVLYDRIAAALADGVITEDEEKELLGVLSHVTGGPSVLNAPGERLSPDTSGLPYDDPAPPIVFANHSFCVTGEFAYGPRGRVISAIEERGGRIAGAPSGKTNFLVVGITGAAAWKHSTHGTKIIKALELKQAGRPIAIIGEKHWTEHL